jgi:hypothetical protein
MEVNKMKKYLIRIETGCNSAFTTINGDSRRPFQVFNNLWNYTTPGHAARRLEKHAQQWEQLGFTVKRVYGTVFDMPTQGNEFNIEKTLLDYSDNASTEKYVKLIRKHYHY